MLRLSTIKHIGYLNKFQLGRAVSCLLVFNNQYVQLNFSCSHVSMFKSAGYSIFILGYVKIGQFF